MLLLLGYVFLRFFIFLKIQRRDFLRFLLCFTRFLELARSIRCHHFVGHVIAGFWTLRRIHPYSSVIFFRLQIIVDTVMAGVLLEVALECFF